MKKGMHHMKGKAARKAAVCILILTGVLFLFSKTIRGWFYPRVTTKTVRSGSIQVTWGKEDLEFSYPDAVQVSSPYGMKTTMSHKAVYVHPGDHVQAGDVLFDFKKEDVDEAYYAIKQNYISALTAADLFAAEYPEALRAAEKRMKEAEKALNRMQRASEDRRAPYQAELDAATKDYDRLAAGIMNGTSKDILDYQVVLTQRALEWLDHVREDNYAVRSEMSGTLIMLSAGFPWEYSVLPDGMPIEMALTISDKEMTDVKMFREGVLSSPVLPEGNQIVERSEIVTKDDRRKLIFRFVPDSISLLSEGNSLSLTLRTGKYPALIPSEAMIDQNTIWIAKSKEEGGRMIWTAHHQTIIPVNGNADYIPCLTDGLDGCRVIVQWDKELEEGKEIIIIDE